MANSKYELAAYKYAKDHGKKVDELSDADHLKIKISCSTPQELVTDGAAAVGTLIKTKLGFKLPQLIKTRRKQICLSGKCGRLGKSSSGHVVCLECGCSGVFMEGALEDPNQECRLPSGRKLWTKYLGEDKTGIPDAANTS